MNFESNENDFSIEDSSFELKNIYRKILQKWLYIAISVFICLIFSWFYTKISSPLYRVDSLFFIKEKENPLALFGPTSLIDNAGMGLHNEVIILKSKPIALRVLKTLDFQVEYFREGSFTNTEIYLNNPIVVEVDWKFSQTIDGLIKVKWENDKEYSLEFIDENYNKLLPEGSKVNFGFQPQPIKGILMNGLKTMN